MRNCSAEKAFVEDERKDPSGLRKFGDVVGDQGMMSERDDDFENYKK